MSALGHTMASMSRGGSKPGANMADSTGARRRSGNRNTGSHDTLAGNGAAARGQNINHLLAFTLPPRMSNSTAQSAARRPRRGGGSSVPFNKERYVNAQYRFLVKPTGDYTAYFADSDIYLNWADILAVIIPTTSALSTASHASMSTPSLQPSHETHEGAACPVCLSRPTAPRMTKCGHVYCYPCILHYLTVNDAPSASGSSTPNTYHHHIPGATPRLAAPASSTTSNGLSPNAAPKWKRCPVCWDAVYARDLKAVHWWDPKARATEFEFEDQQVLDTALKSDSDEYLCMRLIERPHLTTLALPQSSTWPTASTSTSDQPLIAQHSAPWHFQPDVMTFSKFMLATPDLLLDNLNNNMEELSAERSLLQSFLTKDEVGLLFVEMAERKVQEQMEKVVAELDTQSVRSRIGYARKEMVEHYEMERGNRARDEEAVSRRQRKRIERERKHESGGQADDDGQPSSDDTSRPEDVGGAQQFVTLQSQRQGSIQADATITGQGGCESPAKEGKPVGPRTRRNINPPAPSSSSYYFFQASSGQNIFLHPLDIKVLLSAYGSYGLFPRTLQVCIQGADEGSMNEEMRKRCKYLTHLSKGADIVFIEVDWDRMARDAEARSEPAPVSRSVLKMYDQALRQRRNRRKDRERREDRAKVRFEEQERNSRLPVTTDQLIGFGASRSPVLSAADGFSSSLDSQANGSPSLQDAILHGSDASAHSDDEFPSAHAVAGGRESGADGRADGENGSKHEATATQAPRSRPSKPSSASTTVWGTPAAKNTFASALHNSTRSAGTGHQEEDAPDWDSWLELEEDFIVGARNGSSVREGRGLNKQAKRGTHTTELNTPNAKGPTQAQVFDSSSSVAPESEEVAIATAAPRAVPPVSGGKQQKKKKLVLTSGGGGRGTR